MRVTVQAATGSGSDVRAKGDITASALSIKGVQLYTISVGGGFVGVAGAIEVWTVGTQAATTTYEDGGEGNDRGAWLATETYNKGDLVTFVVSGNTKRFIALEDDLEGAGESPTAAPSTVRPVRSLHWIARSDSLLTGPPLAPRIVTPAWVEACWKEGDWLDEEGYAP